MLSPQNLFTFRLLQRLLWLFSLPPPRGLLQDLSSALCLFTLFLDDVSTPR